MRFNLLSLPNLSPELNSAIESVKNDTTESFSDINVGDVISEFVKSMPPEVINKISLFLTIGTYVLVVLFIYVIVKIIKQIMSMEDSKNIKIIAKNTKEINSKLDKKK